MMRLRVGERQEQSSINQAAGTSGRPERPGRLARNINRIACEVVRCGKILRVCWQRH